MYVLTIQTQSAVCRSLSGNDHGLPSFLRVGQRFVAAHEIADDEINQGDGYNHADDHLNVFTVFQYLVVELLFRHNVVEIPAQDGEYGVPCTSADGGVEQEFPIVHLCQSGGNGYQVANAGNEQSRYGGHHAMVVEVFLALLHFLLVD